MVTEEREQGTNPPMLWAGVSHSSAEIVKNLSLGISPGNDLQRKHFAKCL